MHASDAADAFSLSATDRPERSGDVMYVGRADGPTARCMEDSRLRWGTMKAIVDGRSRLHRWFASIDPGYVIMIPVAAAMASILASLVIGTVFPESVAILNTAVIAIPVLATIAMSVCSLVDVSIRKHDAAEMRETCDTWMGRNVLASDDGHVESYEVTAGMLRPDGNGPLDLDAACWDYGPESFHAIADVRDHLIMLADLGKDSKLSDGSVIGVNAIAEVLEKLDSMEARPSEDRRNALSELLVGLGKLTLESLNADLTRMLDDRKKDATARTAADGRAKADAIADSIPGMREPSAHEADIITERRRLDDIIRSMNGGAVTGVVEEHASK